jgi:hypothetical protein
LGIVQAILATHNEQARKRNLAGAKRVLKSRSIPLIFKTTEPIDYLAESVLEVGTPFGIFPARLFLEDRILFPMLEFDDAELFVLFAVQKDVRPKISSQVKLKAYLGCNGDVEIKRADVGGQMLVVFEERLDNFSFVEISVAGEKSRKGVELL